MKKAIACLLILIALFDCTPSDKRIPPDILPVDKMKLIVWDMTQAGEYALYQREKDTALKSSNTIYFNEVLKVYAIDKANFFKSFDFYQSHPLLNKLLFYSVKAFSG